jgi:thymidylate synthase
MSNIPVLAVLGDSLAEAWENSLVKLHDEGCRIKTEYDKPEDPASIDSTMIMTVLDPASEPFIHRAFPGGLEDLEEYRLEVVEGVKNTWVRDPRDLDDKRWEYTYNDRLTNYNGVNQIHFMIDKLARTPHSRRCNAITWKVEDDLGIADPPCFCAGTKIWTPNGLVDVESLKNGDLVYAVDIDNGELIANKVSKFFVTFKPSVKISLGYRSLFASERQKVLTNSGWKEAMNLTSDDCVLVSTEAENVSDSMVVGFLHGDGWLSGGKSHKKNIKRHEVCFSIHPEASVGWLERYVGENYKLKIAEEENLCSSDIAIGLSRKIIVRSKRLWEKFDNLGCPVGKKVANGVGKEIRWNYKKATQQEKKDFLVGIFSAEGCIYVSKNRQNPHPSIQLGMMWEQCIEVVSEILDDFKINHSVYSKKNGCYTIQINKTDDIKRAVDIFDFRLDSRKQAKYIELLYSLWISQKELKERRELIGCARKMRENGRGTDWLRKNVPNYNPRWLKESYRPAMRFRYCECLKKSGFVAIPVCGLLYMGNKPVFDFEVQHPHHAIVANGIISHNCLQSIWCRILVDDDGVWYLNMNVRFRSRDAYDAAFMNMFAFISWQALIAEEVSDRAQREVRLGRYCDISDSYHIYGRRLEHFENNFLKLRKERTFEDRTWTREFVQPIFDEARPKILEKIENYNEQKARQE